jgi:cellulose synthase/poly-beta-1,6-N-acetylglucosamine synthase-like glycosyltransferase
MLTATLTLLLTTGSLIAALPVAAYCLEVLVGCWSLRRKEVVQHCARPRIAVLVPAHNEGAGIAATLRSIKAQLKSEDRLIVVADNCSDDTAAMARSQAAFVLERTNLDQRGKGFALAFGLEHLRTDPPELVLLFDADCRLGEGTVDALAHAAHGARRPVQALYLCQPAQQGSGQQLLSALAFRFKNQIRMAGMAQLGGVCHLAGTGMALPWDIVDKVPWASGNVVEDMQLGIDYALAGLPPRFVPQAKVFSELPTSDTGVLDQRRRWEHGFLQTALKQVPRLLGQAVVRRSWSLAWLALDLAVPPLALLTMLLAAGWFTALVGWLIGIAVMPLAILCFTSLIFLASTLIAWRQHCRDLAPASAWVQVPRYLLAKMPLYLEFLTRHQVEWNRAQRG